MSEYILNTKLPDKFSDLLRVALDDLIAAEKHPDVSINMAEWLHKSAHNDRCQVCMAGSIMLKDQGINKFSSGRQIYPEDFDKDSCRKLRAIDALRFGDIIGAWEKIHEVHINNAPKNIRQKIYHANIECEALPTKSYRDDPKKNKNQIRLIIGILRKYDL